MKCCTICHIFYPLTSFYRNTSKIDGLQNRCKSCVAIYDQRRVKDGREKTRRAAYYVRIKNTPAYRKKNSLATQRYNRRYPKKHNAYNQAHYSRHKVQYFGRAYAYRARKANAPINDFTAAQWREMQGAYDHRCAYCGKRAKGKLTQDHITPLSKGGSHTVSNIVPACRSCNSQKHAGPPLTQVQPLLLTIAPQRD